MLLFAFLFIVFSPSFVLKKRNNAFDGWLSCYELIGHEFHETIETLPSLTLCLWKKVVFVEALFLFWFLKSFEILFFFFSVQELNFVSLFFSFVLLICIKLFFYGTSLFFNTFPRFEPWPEIRNSLALDPVPVYTYLDCTEMCEWIPY